MRVSGSRPAYTLETFFKKRVVVSESGCWEVDGVDHLGYKSVRIKGRRYKAHRWTYEQVKGVIPVGLEIDHLCRNRGCANPDHLEPVTHAENMRRARRTHCRRGHRYTPPTVYVKRNGARDCLLCKSIRRRTERLAEAS